MNSSFGAPPAAPLPPPGSPALPVLAGIGTAAAVLAAAAVVWSAAGDTSTSDAGATITGSQLQQALRANLGSAPGARIDPGRLTCPTDGEYRPGDTVACFAPGAGGAPGRTVLVTLDRVGGEWAFSVDIP